MILFSHPTGNANVRAALAGLLEAGLLAEFHTSIATFPGNLWYRLSQTKPGREFQRRAFDVRLQPLTVQHPWRELGRMLATRLKWSALTRHETGPFCIDAIYQAQDKAVSRELRAASRESLNARSSKLEARNFTGVYCYEDGAFSSFLAARESGIQSLYDLPIAYWETAQKLLCEEAVRLPAWEPTLGGTRDSALKLERKRQELELADVVLCPSRFVVDSLPVWAKRSKKIVIAPFGSPPSGPGRDVRALPSGGSPPSPPLSGEGRGEVVPTSIPLPPSSGRPLRVLFAGSLTQRKGLADLFAALRLLNRRDVELVVLGSLQAPLEFYRKEFPDFFYERPRPHAQVLELMRTCDVFCLPSIVEGRALVMQEAMSQGLPLIITPNTGGDDLIEEGKTGFLVPIRSPESIADKIAWFADHRDVFPDMSRAAQRKAAEYTWEAYGRLVAEAVKGTRGH